MIEDEEYKPFPNADWDKDELLDEIDRLNAMHCRTCQYWIPPQNVNPDYPLPWDKFGTCDLAGTAGGESEDELALALDVEAYGAMLRTQPTFGCVQWKIKEVSL